MMDIAQEEAALTILRIVMVGKLFTTMIVYAKDRGLVLRRYNPDSLVTADYDSNRLNVETDEHDIITKVIGIG